MYVDTFTVEQDAGKNFTPGNVIREWATKNRLEYVNTMDGVNVTLYNSGTYKYHHYDIQPGRNGKEYLTITLERVAA